MISCFPAEDTIHTALSLATRAPSIHDSQPWLWRVGGQSLHLYADAQSGARQADAESPDVLLSCGASLHHCVVALSALGWRAKVRRLPSPGEPQHLAALELYPHPASALDVMLAAAIPRQRSDWRPYSSWPVSAADVALIGARAAGAGVTTRRVERVPDVQSLVGQAIRLRTKDHAHVDDANVTADNAVVLALGTKDDSPMARLRAGEAMSVVLLSATALGLASCPLEEPLESADVRNILHSNLFSIIGVPQMLLRLGWPPVDADPLPSSPRRPLAEVCQWLDDQSLSTA